MAKSRKWTEAQKQAARDRYAARQNQNPEKTQEEIVSQVAQPLIEEKTTEEYEPNVSDLMKQLQEMRDFQYRWMVEQGPTTPRTNINQAGNLTGTFEKYGVSPQLYPSPVERLMQEKKLERYAFPLNYELDYQVASIDYTTIDNVRTREPRFSLTLIRIILDEETGDDTGGRYEICRLMLHEDPETALIIARDNGINVEEWQEEAFLNEMRYLRMRDWLLECFYPAPRKEESNRREVVIQGKLVTYYEKDSESGKGLTKTDWDAAPKVKF